MPTRSDLMRFMPPDPNYPMSPSDVEASRRAVADATFRQQAPVAANMAFEATGLPMMHRGVGNIQEGISEGNPYQAAGGAGQIALGALPYGSGRVISGMIPYGAKAAEYAANLPGVRGFFAQRAAPAAGLVGGTEMTNRALQAGSAVAAEGMPPLPSTQNVEELQRFLQSQGYPIKDDGQMGPNTRKAMADYGQKFQAQQAAAAERAAAERAAQNSPEAIQARLAEQTANAQLKAAQARQLQGQEAERRAGVLTEAEARYDERPEDWGTYVTEEAQKWVGPAIMGAGALLGAKGFAGAPAKRAAAAEVNQLAKRLGKQKTPLSEAQKRAYVETYGQTARGTPVRDLMGTGAAYGALGGEMALSQKYLDDARVQYDKALSEYEAEAASGNLEGGRERELADKVIKNKRAVEKWEGLQGAGLHAMGYMTAGKMASGMLPKGKVSADARQLRNQFRQEMKRPGSGLMPDTPPRPAAPAAAAKAKRRRKYSAADEASIVQEFERSGKISAAKLKRLTENMSPAAKDKVMAKIRELQGQ